MDIFAALSLLIGAGFLVAAFLKQRIADPTEYRSALTLLLVALILYYPVSSLFVVGVYLSFVVRPLGFVLLALSFRGLCLALVSARSPNQ
jgi:hypothetical protein